MKHLVLTSGGLDSATVLALALKDLNTAERRSKDKSITALSFNYGQRHSRELQNAAAVVEAFRQRVPAITIHHEILQVNTNCFRGTNSGLLINHLEEMPNKSYSELEGISPSYVPFRNGVLLSLATAYAMANEHSYVWVGVHAEDARNFAYPDCTMEFIGAMANAMDQGTYHKVRLRAPLQYMCKAEVVFTAVMHNVPTELTRSCYADTEYSCGTCPTCRSRKDAFAINFLEDLIPYTKE